MPVEHSIVIFAVVVVGIVIVTTHPMREAACQIIAGWLSRARGGLPSVFRFSRRRFWFGVAVATFGFVALNAMPHFLTSHAPEHCGLQVMGFPFTFRAVGGYTGAVRFHMPTLIIDALLGLAAAGAIGYIYARLRERQVR